MKRKRFTNDQIAFALRQAESGTAVEEVCRNLGVSEPASSRVPERVLIPIPGGCSGEDRAVEEGVQRGQTPLGPGELDPTSLCYPSSPSPKGCVAPGPELGCSPGSHEPYVRADHLA